MRVKRMSQRDYARNGRIDMDHFLKDFSSWGPIASRIIELRLERNAKAGT